MNGYDRGILIRYTTGHAHLRGHNKLTGSMLPRALTRPEPEYILKDPHDDPSVKDDEEIRCRLCNLKGKEETEMD